MKHEPVIGGGVRVVQLVANPAAGGHCAHRLAAVAEAFEHAGAEVVRSECGPHCSFEVDPRAGHVCVLGGDGTMRHVALAASRCGRPLQLSFYPAGTINLLHREAGCDLDPSSFAARALRAIEPRRHYAAVLDDELFLTCASVGPDSDAVARLSPGLKRRIGRLAYAVAFLRTVITWQRKEIILCHDGHALRCEAFYVAKGRFFAGPWSFAPAARVTEPVLHVVALKKATRRNFLRFIFAMMRGTPIDRVPGAVCFTCTALSAECGTPLPVQADGDIAATLPVEIRLRDEPLSFV
jgi:diacylglycerol kinase family enzyme